MYNSARAAGYSHNTATKAGSRLEIKLTSLSDWMEREGLTDKKLALFLLEALEATKVVGYLHQYKRGENGRIEELKPDEAISNEFLEVPDIAARLKAAELIMKARGQLKTQVEHSGEVKTGETKIIFIYPPNWKPKNERIENTTQRLSG